MRLTRADSAGITSILDQPDNQKLRDASNTLALHANYASRLRTAKYAMVTKPAARARKMPASSP
jgi:hypothetical protein